MLLIVAAGMLGLVAPPSSTVIVGAGPAGLATAISLARRGFENIRVVDRLPPPPALEDTEMWGDTARFYLIGIGGRGSGALRSIGAWDAVEPYTQPVVGRKDWAPGAGVDRGVQTIRSDRPPTNVIARDRLVACLLKLATEELGVQVRHEVDVTGVRWDGEHTAILQCRDCSVACQAEPVDAAASGTELAAETEPASRIEATAPGKPEDDTGECFELSAPLLVASDGARRTIAEAMQAEDASRRWVMPGSRFRIRKYADTSVRVYKTVPFTPPSDWRGDINYSARTKAANFDALPALGGSYCGVLLVKSDDQLTLGLKDVPAARAYFDELLPMFSPHITDASLAAVIDKPTSRLPLFRYAAPRAHHRHSTVLLGDAIHSVKPYFGLGANAALEDVVALNTALDSAPTLAAALRAYSRARAPEARILVEISRSFDYAGIRSFFTFIGPLILDGIFHGALPRIFAPNTLTMLQKPELSFGAIRRRKRQDRLLQLCLVTAVLAAVGSVAAAIAAAAVRIAARTTLPAAARPLAMALPFAAAAAAALVVRRKVGSDVADVMAATTAPSKAIDDREVVKGGTGGAS